MTITRQLRVALFRAPLDRKAFATALETALGAGQIAFARALAEACRPALAAQLAARVLTEHDSGGDPRRAVDELRTTFVSTLSQGRDLIVVLGRVANPIALIGVIFELGTAAHGGEGLLGLQSGLVARIALQRSLLTFSLGFSTSLLCFAAAAILQRASAGLRASLDEVAAVVELEATKTGRGAM
ncbi:MAG: hypothetical protein ACHQ53_07980 [Polyangiales bacterium]